MVQPFFNFGREEFLCYVGANSFNDIYKFSIDLRKKFNNFHTFTVPMLNQTMLDDKLYYSTKLDNKIKSGDKISPTIDLWINNGKHIAALSSQLKKDIKKLITKEFNLQIILGKRDVSICFNNIESKDFLKMLFGSKKTDNKIDILTKHFKKGLIKATDTCLRFAVDGNDEKIEHATNKVEINELKEIYNLINSKKNWPRSLHDSAKQFLDLIKMNLQDERNLVIFFPLIYSLRSWLKFLDAEVENYPDPLKEYEMLVNIKKDIESKNKFLSKNTSYNIQDIEDLIFANDSLTDAEERELWDYKEIKERLEKRHREVERESLENSSKRIEIFLRQFNQIFFYRLSQTRTLRPNPEVNLFHRGSYIRIVEMWKTVCHKQFKFLSESCPVPEFSQKPFSVLLTLSSMPDTTVNVNDFVCFISSNIDRLFDLRLSLFELIHETTEGYYTFFTGQKKKSNSKVYPYLKTESTIDALMFSTPIFNYNEKIINNIYWYSIWRFFIRSGNEMGYNDVKLIDLFLSKVSFYIFRKLISTSFRNNVNIGTYESWEKLLEMEIDLFINFVENSQQDLLISLVSQKKYKFYEIIKHDSNDIFDYIIKDDKILDSRVSNWITSLNQKRKTSNEFKILWSGLQLNDLANFWEYDDKRSIRFFINFITVTLSESWDKLFNISLEYKN